MNWFNGYGLLFVLLLLVPNVIFAWTHNDGFKNRYHNRLLETLEQVGRFSCFDFMAVAGGLTAGRPCIW